MSSKRASRARRTERNAAGVTPKQRDTAPWWLKAAVLLHLVAITIWCIPNPPREVMQGKRGPIGTEWLLVANTEYLRSIPPLQAYMLGTGMWQYWDMFAPNPSQVDLYCTAEIVYRDGTKSQYHYPRIYDYPIAMKYPMERYRKFYERVNDDGNSWLWPIFAQRIAEIVAHDPNNPPVEVLLRRHWLLVLGPDQVQPTQYQSTMFYDYKVDEHKLRRDLGWP